MASGSCRPASTADHRGDAREPSRRFGTLVGLSVRCSSPSRSARRRPRRSCIGYSFRRSSGRRSATCRSGSYLSGGHGLGLDHGHRRPPPAATADLHRRLRPELRLGPRARVRRAPGSRDARQPFKTEHYEVVLHAGDMEEVLPELIWHLEDLRVGQSYPNYYVARLAGKFVKVVLSGAGGDELFGGYPWRYYRGIEATDREDYFRRYYGFWQRLVPDDDKATALQDSVHTSSDRRAFDIRRLPLACSTAIAGPFDGATGFVNASLYFELKTFLHGLLVVEDKLSMAHSLETRVPFLDNDLVDFAVRLPPDAQDAQPGSASRRGRERRRQARRVRTRPRRRQAGPAKGDGTDHSARGDRARQAGIQCARTPAGSVARASTTSIACSATAGR